ncbi:hypothetical protein A9D60_06075 [Leisingera sp. JC1]|nr:hypothetical protein A9D60_06075 [Leisingera sp. JC1]
MRSDRSLLCKLLQVGPAVPDGLLTVMSDPSFQSSGFSAASATMEKRRGWHLDLNHFHGC